MGPEGPRVTRAVLDTNVVISALVFQGPAKALVSFWQRKRILLLASQALVEEHIRVLHYPKFRLTQAEIRYLVEEELLPFITPVKVRRVPDVIREDPADNQVLACASAGRAGLIVTGDHHLLVLSRYRQVPIVTISEFLKRVDR